MVRGGFFWDKKWRVLASWTRMSHRPFLVFEPMVLGYCSLACLSALQVVWTPQFSPGGFILANLAIPGRTRHFGTNRGMPPQQWSLILASFPALV
ncbi:kelch repeat-containing F-box family protein [Corchorus olitorius]|uniref:Kelch repeat-containing F-box family protein n=1 Tax=Corchorus olitorius TaxID=93759 RepID=A0A1R3GXQ4_9ROSI|nr:kelch repeat-containing F-box family protein [Corchorus olitorius]